MNLQQGLSVEQLREMAARQQQQIEMQQQQLVAKEQRLKYLKQQEYQHHQMASEYDRLRRYSRHWDCNFILFVIFKSTILFNFRFLSSFAKPRTAQQAELCCHRYCVRKKEPMVSVADMKY